MHEDQSESAQAGGGVPVSGLAWCFTFLILDAIQAVYCGGIFQRLDAFGFGAIVFGQASVQRGAEGAHRAALDGIDPAGLESAFRHVFIAAGLLVALAAMFFRAMEMRPLKTTIGATHRAEDGTGE